MKLKELVKKMTYEELVEYCVSKRVRFPRETELQELLEPKNVPSIGMWVRVMKEGTATHAFAVLVRVDEDKKVTVGQPVPFNNLFKATAIVVSSDDATKK